MSAPESAAGGTPKTPAELLVTRLSLLEKRIGELVVDAGEGAWQLVPNNGGTVATAYGRGAIGDMGALVAVSKWHRPSAEPGEETRKYGMQVLGESPLVVWPTGGATVEAVQFEHPKRHKPIRPDFSKALQIAHLVLSAEHVELPAALTPLAWLKKAWLENTGRWGGANGRGNFPYHP